MALFTYDNEYRFLVTHNLLRISPENVFCIEALPMKWQPYEVHKSLKQHPAERTEVDQYYLILELDVFPYLINEIRMSVCLYDRLPFSLQQKEL